MVLLCCAFAVRTTFRCRCHLSWAHRSQYHPPYHLQYHLRYHLQYHPPYHLQYHLQYHPPYHLQYHLRYHLQYHLRYFIRYMRSGISNWLMLMFPIRTPSRGKKFEVAIISNMNKITEDIANSHTKTSPELYLRAGRSRADLGPIYRAYCRMMWSPQRHCPLRLV